MDVRFYPAPPANVGSCTLPTDPSCLSSLDYYHPSKARHTARLHPDPASSSAISPARKRLAAALFDGDNMYMNDNNQEFRVAKPGKTSPHCPVKPTHACNNKHTNWQTYY
ncbi:hypothetical protein NQD34_005590 [Periophthalmus magnuspinnatus]|nr:hypothetical protein NQD34_005590 [Periophthalmus magnuspinnatus]